MAFRGHSIVGVFLDEVAEFPRGSPLEKSVTPPDIRGMDGDDQLVVVNHKYGYAWPGPGFLKEGDIVVLPGASGRSWWIGKVTDLGSDFNGQFKRIMRKATARDMEIYRERVEEEQRRRGLREFKSTLMDAVRSGKRRL